MAIKFSKMQATGNDFVVIDNIDLSTKLSPSEITQICDRHFGIGADGLILVEPAREPDSVAFMNYYNSDGSTAEMCGNGSRCFALYLIESGQITLESEQFNIDNLKVDTRAGQKSITISSQSTSSTQSTQFIHGNQFNATVNMGVPKVDSSVKSIEIGGENIQITSVNMGNPHCVVFIDNEQNSALHNILCDDDKVHSLGKAIEHASSFPHKTNVEFVKQIGKDTFEVRVWERGVGETLACGTGACAVAAAADADGLANLADKISIDMAGGKLVISQNSDGSVDLSGPATTVFTGVI